MITETSIAPAAGIAAGTLVGGRFLIERRVSSGAIGELLFARDQKTRKPIAVWALSQSFAGDAGIFELIRGEVRNVARLKHRSLVGTYGIGTHGEQRFIACEWVHGTSLAELVARVRAEHPLSLRGIYNVIAHVCNALGYVHGESSFHGGLRPHVVWISKSGRVKVAELGLGAALARSGKWQLLAAD
jgi:serine/threonine protein kinase